MKYFSLNMTLDQAQSRYRDLCRVLHPDTGKSVTGGEEFALLKQEYDDIQSILRNLDWIKSELKHQVQIVERPVVIKEQIAPPQVNLENIAGKAVDFVSQITQALKESNKLYRNATRRPRRKA